MKKKDVGYCVRLSGGRGSASFAEREGEHKKINTGEKTFTV